MQINIPEVRETRPEQRWASAASAGLRMPRVFQKLLGSCNFLSSGPGPVTSESQSHSRSRDGDGEGHCEVGELLPGSFLVLARQVRTQ